ncbi:hypothetical protein BDY21DRAFT_343605 [Lineolata rhizophorae]|uniref:Uncharacterized protein n=1 Tax=Lineolata rhizophorae TaxID=578093 RepID=A0A6A6P1L2_9PEZI|nr:hypothetical protein BDY21DRAFT_343605 [Lineolata rhizophorae]
MHSMIRISKRQDGIASTPISLSPASTLSRTWPTASGRLFPSPLHIRHTLSPRVRNRHSAANAARAPTRITVSTGLVIETATVASGAAARHVGNARMRVARGGVVVVVMVVGFPDHDGGRGRVVVVAVMVVVRRAPVIPGPVAGRLVPFATDVAARSCCEAHRRRLAMEPMRWSDDRIPKLRESSSRNRAEGVFEQDSM